MHQALKKRLELSLVFQEESMRISGFPLNVVHVLHEFFETLPGIIG
jgi:hypothetical protein